MPLLLSSMEIPYYSAFMNRIVIQLYGNKGFNCRVSHRVRVINFNR